MFSITWPAAKRCKMHKDDDDADDDDDDDYDEDDDYDDFHKHSTDQHNVSWDIYVWRALTWSLEQFSVGREDSEEKLLRRFFFSEA